MLNKNCIKTILNVKYTCIDKVTMLADTSVMIEVHATKGEQCRCGICGKKSKFYDNGNEGARTWRACDWAGHKVILVGPSCRVNCKEHGCYPAFYLVLNHPTFNQIKKKHGINYSDKFYIRLLYAVSFVLSYSLPHKKIAGLTLEKSGLLLLTHR